MAVRLNRRVAAIKPSATMAAEARAIELRQQGIDVISLAAGEPDFDTPERIKMAARRALDAGLTKYTPTSGTRELKEAIRLKLKTENDLDYDLAEIVACAGGKQAAANVIATLFDEGDEVIIPTPAWVSYAAMVALSGATPKLVPAREADGFILSAEQLRRALGPNTRGIIINSPANPTGAVYQAPQLLALAEVILQAGLWLLSDDVYEHMVYEGVAPHPFKVEPRLRERGVIVNSLSKTYAMTGWRIGFAAGPREVISAVGRLQGQNSGNPNSITQAAAVEALTGPKDELRAMMAEFRSRRSFVVDRVRSLPGFELAHAPAGSFYVFPKVSALFGLRWRGGLVRSGDELAEMLLSEARVALVGGTDFGFPEHVRISYANSLTNLKAAFDRIEDALKALGAKR
jgi:aspartate aminotransferase